MCILYNLFVFLLFPELSMIQVLFYLTPAIEGILLNSNLKLALYQFQHVCVDGKLSTKSGVKKNLLSHRPHSY